MNIDIYKYVNNYIGILIVFYYVNEFNEVEFMLFFVFILKYKV